MYNKIYDNYNGSNDYDIPTIKKEPIKNLNLQFVGFDKINSKKMGYRALHFFLDDTKFNRVYKYPEKYIEKIAKYDIALTPDFSLYIGMSRTQQIKNVFKNRWCGAYWQEHGIKVIPTIGWSDEKSFEYCFLGVEKGSIVAVSTLGAKRNKERFMCGYNAMLEIISPEVIYCYDKPFSEMKGNVIYIDYLKSTGRCA